MSGRRIEIFTAGCWICDETVEAVREAACPSCRVEARNVNDAAVAARARSLGVRSVPAVAIDGVLASCCTATGPDIESLRNAGLGKPI